MKYIEMKTVEAMVEGKPMRISYRAQLQEIMRHPADAKGLDVESLRRSIRVLDALDAVTLRDSLVLEDADYEHLRREVLAVRWHVVDKAILQFVEDVTNAQTEANHA